MHCPLYNIHRQQLVDSFNKLNIEFTIQNGRGFHKDHCNVGKMVCQISDVAANVD
jgi:hypothetical protein